MTDKEEPRQDQKQKPLKQPEPKPVAIPTCGRCHKPLTQCQCTENDLRK